MVFALPRNFLVFIVAALLISSLNIFVVQVQSEDYDGYEYEYEYEVEGDISVEATVKIDNIAANAASKKEQRRLESLRKQAEMQRAQKIAEEAAASEAARAAEIARQLAEEDQLLIIQRRNQGKHGYKKAVGGGSFRTDLPKLADSRFITTTEASTGCVLAELWGKPIAIDEKKHESKKNIDDKKKHSESDMPTKSGRTAADSREGHKEDTGEVAESDAEDTSSAGKGKKPKKPTFREMQAKMLDERREKEASRQAQRGTLQAGTSCERLICGACKVVAEEFAIAVVEGGTLDKYPYVEDVLTGFCQRNMLELRYHELVRTMCMSVTGDKVGYRDALLRPVEEEQQQWERMAEPLLLRPNVRKSCLAIGACDKSHFEMQLAPKKREQEHWDDKCYVCQAFAHELEERLHLMRGVTEVSVMEVVRTGCNRVYFPSDNLRDLCQALVSGSALDDVAWIAFMHSENIARKGKTERVFADSMCESVSFCEKWVDPDAEIVVAQEEVYF